MPLGNTVWKVIPSASPALLVTIAKTRRQHRSSVWKESTVSLALRPALLVAKGTLAQKEVSLHLLPLRSARLVTIVLTGSRRRLARKENMATYLASRLKPTPARSVRKVISALKVPLERL